MSLALTYAKIPRVNCKGKCQASCGPIMAEPTEEKAFEASTGKPFPDVLAVLASPTLTCPYLQVADGKCSVYQHRPIICRLWGAVDVDMMRCPHGCQPERWLTDAESRALIEETR